MNEYELARDRRIASNGARLAELGVSSLACQFAEKHLSKPGQLKTRAPRVRGAAPTRKSERLPKTAHAVLSEIVLSGETPSGRLRYTLSRTRFESESMSLKRKAQHEFDEAFVFKNRATQRAAGEWFYIFKVQPELNALDWESTCEHLAFNLGQQGLTKDSLAGENEETAGIQIASRRVLKHLRSGETAATASGHERRHGEGQSLANAAFRRFVLKMMATYGTHAKKGIGHFESVPERKQEVTKVINHTWSLIKDMSDAKQMYANGSGLGSGHNYLFRKMLVRKFGEEIKGNDDDDDLENEAPNIPFQSTDTA